MERRGSTQVQGGAEMTNAQRRGNTPFHARALAHMHTDRRDRWRRLNMEQSSHSIPDWSPDLICWHLLPIRALWILAPPSVLVEHT